MSTLTLTASDSFPTLEDQVLLEEESITYHWTNAGGTIASPHFDIPVEYYNSYGAWMGRLAELVETIQEQRPFIEMKRGGGEW